MTSVTALLQRLDQLAESLQQRADAIALLGLGSVGTERERLDPFSDLDFFVIAAPGGKRTLLDDLTWLSGPAPLAFHFFNTADGCKALYDDGVFCEFAVFEMAELADIAFAAGQVIWARPEVDTTQLNPRPDKSGAAANNGSDEWLIGEALTNLLVGMQRDLRGETLSAMRFIQHYAVDRVLDLVERHDSAPQSGALSERDAFSIERRFEMRHLHSALWLAGMIQGYQSNAQSALAVLSYLQSNYAVNSAIANEINQLCLRALDNPDISD
ncbi:hypothetical protein IC617_00210 [Neiella sp. HB171785]|uniref:Nucleotidyltransferase domain-containing protein n=1 Tax=Neiella litorisoli TaxID=2771431 RepID=A0A8J6QTC1_9GAMM|nr:hypothetical protein [Neiella litorisoli]MBD1387838.1 hypothetical protein [Neiella litorisoli]